MLSEPQVIVASPAAVCPEKSVVTVMQNSGSFVLGTQQLHFEVFTLNTDDITALSTQDVHCAFTVLPKVSHAFDFRETNTTKYHLYYFCLLNHIHGISENYTILPAELDVHTKHAE